MHRNGLKTALPPLLHVSPVPRPKAFATGRDPQHAAVATVRTR